MSIAGDSVSVAKGREREREREREKERDRETDRQRERDREREKNMHKNKSDRKVCNRTKVSNAINGWKIWCEVILPKNRIKVEIT